jgi:hypothetical protein
MQNLPARAIWGGGARNLTAIDVELFRLARPEEAPRVQAFFEEHQDRHVMPRGEEVYRKTAAGETLFVAIADPRGQRDWAGVSGVFDVDREGLLLREAGGSRVARIYEGRGLHKVFHCLRALTIALFEPEYDKYFGAIIAPNPKSEHNLRQLGFDDWADPPDWLVAERAPYADQAGESIKYFKLEDAAFQPLAERLLGYRDSGVIAAKDGTVSCRVSFDVPILAADLRHGVEEIAQRGYSSSRPR